MSLRNTLPFATIPEWLLEADVSDRAVRLYGLLVRHADQEGHAFPSRKRLSLRLRCSVDSVDRAIRELAEVGAVEVRHRQDEAGDRTSNDYLLRPGGRIPAATPLGIPAATVAAPVRQELEPLELEPSERENTFGFAEFYAVFPRHEKPGAAEKAYRKALKSASAEEILAGAIRYAEDPNLPTDKTYILHPASWLNAKGWLSEPLPPRVNGHVRETQEQRLARLAEGM